MNPDATIVTGPTSRTRYSCRSVTEVDAHLLAITDWVKRNRYKRAQAALAKYTPDIDLLLNARVMLTVLGTLDDDLNGLEPRACVYASDG